ncbi:uncharacterized protein [Blastocystis hominis]|uniref:Uncharacterized protein n=1 Tax=Blastocystis hominis TaxID=12968 RepID=D8M141_BLAHO|nr:uncharacterized protein [Blastocystis hominis]CBK21780.2 unnamed protein product [Blastocystis hominis]|eukprot:XP_012895828.1 uncharacterized protein [Blastocystis hominis]
MCMWALQQSDEFFDEKLNEVRYGGGIWNLISNVLHLTREQKHAILCSRQGTVQQQENVGMAMDIIDEVQKRMENSMNSMKEQLKGIVNVLTPEQQVESLLFIQKVLQEPRSQESIFNTLKKRIDVQENESSSTPEEEEEEEGN